MDFKGLKVKETKSQKVKELVDSLFLSIIW